MLHNEEIREFYINGSPSIVKVVKSSS